jgi:hypothetical protein
MTKSTVNAMSRGALLLNFSFIPPKSWVRYAPQDFKRSFSQKMKNQSPKKRSRLMIP